VREDELLEVKRDNSSVQSGEVEEDKSMVLFSNAQAATGSGEGRWGSAEVPRIPGLT